MNTPAEPRARIPLAEPLLGELEQRYVSECMASGWISTAGPWVQRFEETLVACVGGGGAVAVSSGTAALHVALRLAGVGPDDEVVVPALTFVATANAARYLGAWPVFCDVDREHLVLDPEGLRDFLETGCEPGPAGPRNRASGRTVKAVVPVHLLGHPADMDPICELAQRHGLAVIEDASQALGARYRGRPVGLLGDAACFSFNGNKLATAGGGGAIVSEDPAWIDRAGRLSRQSRCDPVEQIHDEVGYNYRLTSLAAAVGCAQLERLDEMLERKRCLSAEYRAALADVRGVIPLEPAAWVEPASWLTAIRIDATRYGRSARELRIELERSDIESRLLWQPLHRSPAHAGASAWNVNQADRAYEQVLCLPSSSGLTAEQLEAVVSAVSAPWRPA